MAHENYLRRFSRELLQMDCIHVRKADLLAQPITLMKSKQTFKTKKYGIFRMFGILCCRMHVEQVFGADVYRHPFYLPWLLFSISIKILNGSMHWMVQCNAILILMRSFGHLIIYHAETKKGQALKIESERKRVCWIKRLHTFGELQLNDDGSCKRFSNFSIWYDQLVVIHMWNNQQFSKVTQPNDTNSKLQK